MSEDLYNSLLKKFDITKRELGDAENSIRRITGRNPDDIINGVSGGSKYRPNTFTSSERKGFYTGREKRKRMQPTKEDSSPVDHVSEESSPDESPVKKPSLASTVVAKSHQAKSRKATIAEQNVNSKLRARNHRIFQALIGTLEKFQTEEKKRQHVVSMRAEIEKKVEATTEEEREEIKKEKKTLFATRKLKLIELRCLEKKIERAESYEVFEKVHKHMWNFIKTKAKPSVFFLPASHTPETKKRFEESKNLIQDVLKKKKAELESDLAEIEESYQRDSDSAPPVPGDEKQDKPLHDKNGPDIDSHAENSTKEYSDARPRKEMDENSQESNYSEKKNEFKEEAHSKDDIESQNTIENESESLPVEQDDTGLEDDEPPFERHLVDSLSDQEFVPIYD